MNVRRKEKKRVAQPHQTIKINKRDYRSFELYLKIWKREEMQRICGVYMKKYAKHYRAENTGKPLVRKSASEILFSLLALPVEFPLGVSSSSCLLLVCPVLGIVEHTAHGVSDKN
jgi:hypothetical protein